MINNMAEAKLVLTGSLSAKLLEVMKAVTRVEKRGENQFHGYKYATESDLVDMVRGELSSRGIRTKFNLVSTARTPKGEKGGFITDIEVDWTFVDSESGETETSRVPGSGEDKGDKGVYKALTGSEKYWLMKTFLIPTGDDPEKDNDARGAGDHRPAQQPAAGATNGTPPQRNKMPTRPLPTVVAKPSNGNGQDPVIPYEGTVDKVQFNKDDATYWMVSVGKYFWTRETAVGQNFANLVGSRVIVTCTPSAKRPNTFQLLTISKVEDN
jgi:ERF superfamily protein